MNPEEITTLLKPENKEISSFDMIKSINFNDNSKVNSYTLNK